MRAGVLRGASTASRATGYALGAAVIVSAAAIAIGPFSLAGLLEWLASTLGYLFLGCATGLVVATIYAWINMVQDHARAQFWMQAGLQTASGVATLALTFTLLGISLGIGALAEHPLGPETVQQIVQELTARFSLAFLTTVIGLPLATILRAGLLITHARIART